MNFKVLSVAVPPLLLLLGAGAANAGQTINEVGAIACVNDKWDVKEPEKGHKLVDYAGRCINAPTMPPYPSPRRTARESTSTCLMRVGRQRDLHLYL